MFAKLLRLYAYLYHLLLALFLLGLATVAVSSSKNLRLEMLPWTETELTRWLIGLGLLALVSIVLAVTGFFRFLFPVWAFVALTLMVRGFLIKPYTFSGEDSFYQTLWLIGGALLAFLASLTLLRRKRQRRY